MRALLAALVVVSVSTAFADEPGYCTPSEFYKYEINNQYPKVKNVHAFKLGEVTLVGMAVGNSKAEDVIKMAEGIAQVPPSDSYCTWYLNEGDGDAERVFRHVYVPNPRTLSEQESYEVYGDRLGNEFLTNAHSFVACVEKYNYAGLGCNGQKHRGPTVFGMLLAYSGCTPEHSLEIVNTLWKLNGVPAKNRLSAIKAGYDLGNAETQGREALQKKFLGSRD